MKRTIAVFGCLVWLSTPAAAQLSARLKRALTAIYSRNEFSPEAFGPAVWLDNGSRYAISTDERLVAYDTASGVASTVASSTELNATGNIGSFTFSDDGSKVLLFTNSRRVWRLNTRGDTGCSTCEHIGPSRSIAAHRPPR